LKDWLRVYARQSRSLVLLARAHLPQLPPRKLKLDRRVRIGDVLTLVADLHGRVVLSVVDDRARARIRKLGGRRVGSRGGA
jgi:hypothetical protein